MPDIPRPIYGGLQARSDDTQAVRRSCAELLENIKRKGAELIENFENRSAVHRRQSGLIEHHSKVNAYLEKENSVAVLSAYLRAR